MTLEEYGEEIGETKGHSQAHHTEYRATERILPKNDLVEVKNGEFDRCHSSAPKKVSSKV